MNNRYDNRRATLGNLGHRNSTYKINKYARRAPESPVSPPIEGLDYETIRTSVLATFIKDEKLLNPQYQSLEYVASMSSAADPFKKDELKSYKAATEQQIAIVCKGASGELETDKESFIQFYNHFKSAQKLLDNIVTNLKESQVIITQSSSELKRLANEKKNMETELRVRSHILQLTGINDRVDSMVFEKSYHKACALVTDALKDITSDSLKHELSHLQDTDTEKFRTTTFRILRDTKTVLRQRLLKEIRTLLWDNNMHFPASFDMLHLPPEHIISTYSIKSSPPEALLYLLSSIVLLSQSDNVDELRSNTINYILQHLQISLWDDITNLVLTSIRKECHSEDLEETDSIMGRFYATCKEARDHLYDPIDGAINTLLPNQKNQTAMFDSLLSVTLALGKSLGLFYVLFRYITERVTTPNIIDDQDLHSKNYSIARLQSLSFGPQKVTLFFANALNMFLISCVYPDSWNTLDVFSLSNIVETHHIENFEDLEAIFQRNIVTKENYGMTDPQTGTLALFTLPGKDQQENRSQNHRVFHEIKETMKFDSLFSMALNSSHCIRGFSELVTECISSKSTLAPSLLEILSGVFGPDVPLAINKMFLIDLKAFNTLAHKTYLRRKLHEITTDNLELTCRTFEIAMRQGSGVEQHISLDSNKAVIDLTVRICGFIHSCNLFYKNISIALEKADLRNEVSNAICSEFVQRVITIINSLINGLFKCIPESCKTVIEVSEDVRFDEAFMRFKSQHSTLKPLMSPPSRENKRQIEELLSGATSTAQAICTMEDILFAKQNDVKRLPSSLIAPFVILYQSLAYFSASVSSFGLKRQYHRLEDMSNRCRLVLVADTLFIAHTADHAMSSDIFTALSGKYPDNNVYSIFEDFHSRRMLIHACLQLSEGVALQTSVDKVNYNTPVGTRKSILNEAQVYSDILSVIQNLKVTKTSTNPLIYDINCPVGLICVRKLVKYLSKSISPRSHDLSQVSQYVMNLETKGQQTIFEELPPVIWTDCITRLIDLLEFYQARPDQDIHELFTKIIDKRLQKRDLPLLFLTKEDILKTAAIHVVPGKDPLTILGEDNLSFFA